MSRDNQIEEMAKVIQNTYLPINQGNVTVGETRLYSRDAHRLAENLYNAGYRKSTDVAEEIFAEIEKTFKDCLWFLENHPSDYPKMDRTKINVYKDNLQYIAEIKNKYKGE